MKYKILLILFIISLIGSCLLAYNGHNASEICDPNAHGCSTVSMSEYSSTFGIDNNYYGILIFLFMSTLTYFHIKNPKKRKSLIIKTGVTIGAIISLYFIYLQQFIIQAWCKYCLVVDFSMIVAFGIVFFSWRKKRKWRNQ